jgi:hypothetical protein
MANKLSMIMHEIKFANKRLQLKRGLHYFGYLEPMMYVDPSFISGLYPHAHQVL